MSCKRYEEWLALEVGGDLPPDKATQLATHLAECNDCRRIAEELRASQAALRSFHRSPLVQDRLDAVRSAVLAKLETAKPSPFWQRHSGVTWLTPRWALAGAALVLVATTAFWTFDSPNRIEPETVATVKPAYPNLGAPPRTEPRPSQPAREPREENVGARHAVPSGPPQASPAQQLAPTPPRRDPVPTKAEHAAAPTPEKIEPEITVISPPQTDTDDPEHNQDTVLQVASSDPDIKIYWLVGRNGD